MNKIESNETWEAQKNDLLKRLATITDNNRVFEAKTKTAAIAELQEHNKINDLITGWRVRVARLLQGAL